MTDTERRKDKPHNLHLKGMRPHLDTVLAQASEKNLDVSAPLNLLADIEIEQRWQNAILLRGRQSALKDKLTIDQFHCDHHQSSTAQTNRILTLLHLAFVSAHSDVIFIGHPGTGQTFLAKCLADAACNANIKVLFTTAIDRINQLIAAEADHSRLQQLHHYAAPDLLVVDERGYLSLGQQGAHLFFPVISQRHQLHSTVITTNLPCAEWGTGFDSTTVATAIADRLVHNAEVLILGGTRYRRKLT